MFNIRVALDDGHGIETSGKRTPFFDDGSFMKENEFNSAVVNIIGLILKKYNINVIYVAESSSDISLYERVKIANDSNADIYVSIHANAFGNNWNDANGFETLIYSYRDKKVMELAKDIHNECVNISKLKDRGIKERKDLYVLNKTKMPAVLLECGFMTNKKEAELLRSSKYRENIAVAVSKGILKYFNIKLNEGDILDINTAKDIIKKKCNFDDNTMKYLEFYRFSESMIIRLAEAML